MKRGISITLGSFCLLLLLLAPSTSHPVQTNQLTQARYIPVPGHLTLTVYQNQNLALIEEKRTLELTQGIVEYPVTGVSTKLLPDSVQLAIPDAPKTLQLLEQRFMNDPISLEHLLRAHLGQEIEVFTTNGAERPYRGRLISAQGGIILQEESGQIQVLQNATRFHFPAQPLSEPMLLWTIQSEHPALQPIELRYLSEGLDWRAYYTAVIDPSEVALDLQSWVSLTNETGLDLEETQLHLVAGQIHRVERRLLPPLVAEAAKAELSPFTEQPSFEYHLYTLERPARLPDGETTHLAFLEARAVPVAKKYIYAAHVQEGVQVWVEFLNRDPLGSPLPAGIMRLYQRSLSGIQFIGEDRIGHTPVGERVQLQAGQAFDLVAQRTQTSHEQLGERAFRDSYRITLTNYKDKDVLIQVRERLHGTWRIVASEPEFQRFDAYTITFQVPVASGGTAVVQYTVESILPY